MSLSSFFFANGRRFCAVALATSLLCSVVMTGKKALAQATNRPAESGTATSPVADPDAQVVEPATTPGQATLRQQAWQKLSDAVGDGKPDASAEKHVDVRIQALAALGTMGGDARSIAMIAKAMQDNEVDVRTAAVLAAGQTRSRAMIPLLRRMIDDKEPQVAFAAASALWKMGDHEGQDLLAAVVDGERRASATLIDGTMHSMNREMHDPEALAKLGAMQGASMLLGPFGYGITAYEYVTKNGGAGGSARVTALEEIAQVHSPAMRSRLLGALADKDVGVRAAAAKALRGYHDAAVARALAAAFDDSKRPVQFAAAAAYLISTGAVVMPPATPLQR